LKFKTPGHTFRSLVQLLLYHVQLMRVRLGSHFVQLHPGILTLHGSSHFPVPGLKFISPGQIIGSLLQLLLYHLQLIVVSTGSHFVQLQPGISTLHGSSHFPVAGLKFRWPGHIIGSIVQLLLYHLQLMAVRCGSHFVHLHPGISTLHGSSHFPVAGLKFRSPVHIIGSLLHLLLYHLQLMGCSSVSHFLQSHPWMRTSHGSSHFPVAGLKFNSPGHIIGSLLFLLRYHLQLMGVSSGSHFVQLHPGMQMLHGSSHFRVVGLKFSLPGHIIGSIVQLLRYHLQLMGVSSGSHFVQLHPGISTLHGSSHFPVAGLKFKSPEHFTGSLVQLLLYHLQLRGVSLGSHFVQLHPMISTLHGSSHFPAPGLKFRSPGHLFGSIVQLLRYHLQLMGVSSGTHLLHIHPVMLTLHGSSHFRVAGLKFRSFGHIIGSLLHLSMYHLQLIRVSSVSHFVQLHLMILTLHGSSHVPVAGLKFRSPGHIIGLVVQLLLYHLQLMGVSTGLHVLQLHPRIEILHGSSHFSVSGLKLFSP
jgi:hypothetical protein